MNESSSMDVAFCRHQPEAKTQKAARTAFPFERALAASVRCARPRRGTRARRVRTQCAVDGERDLGDLAEARAWPKIAVQLLQLGAGQRSSAAAEGALNVRARAGRGRCAIEAQSHIEAQSQCDRNGACCHPGRKRAHR
eukprot:979861-Prymnesium_polylepis.2